MSEQIIYLIFIYTSMFIIVIPTVGHKITECWDIGMSSGTSKLIIESSED